MKQRERELYAEGITDGREWGKTTRARMSLRM